MAAWGELLSLSKDFSPNVALVKPVVKIGRGKACDIRLKCDVVSTNHCYLTRDSSGAVTITDTSRNGTYIDGKVLRSSTKPLANGAEIGVSLHEASVIKFIYRHGQPITPTAASAGSGLADGPRSLEAVYDMGPKLGSGAFATVFEGTHKVTKVKVAIKRIDKKRAMMMSACRSSVEDVLQAEVDILKRLRHQNIVGLKDSFDTDRYFYIVLEYASAGELFDKIIEKSKFTEDQAQGLFHQIMNGINYLHSQDVAHRDLKPENILLHRVSDARVGRYVVKITDFGMSRVVPPSNLMNTFAGTPQYLAPEVLSSSTSGQGYGRQVDMWSLGVILYILLSGMQPFSDSPTMPLLDQVKAGTVRFPPAQWATISADAKDLVMRLLTVDPKARITGEGVMLHPWMQSRMAPRKAKAQAQAKGKRKATGAAKGSAGKAVGTGASKTRQGTVGSGNSTTPTSRSVKTGGGGGGGGSGGGGGGGGDGEGDDGLKSPLALGPSETLLATPSQDVSAGAGREFVTTTTTTTTDGTTTAYSEDEADNETKGGEEDGEDGDGGPVSPPSLKKRRRGSA